MRKSFIYIILIVTSLSFSFLACSQPKKLSQAQQFLAQRDKIQKSIVLIKNEKNILPLQNLEKLSIASLTINTHKNTLFQDFLSKYTSIENFHLDILSDTSSLREMQHSLNEFNTILIALYPDSTILEKGFSVEFENFINRLGKKSNIILSVFCKNEIINQLTEVRNIKSILLAQNNEDLNQQLSAEIIFGGTSAIGKLKETINETYSESFGIQLAKKERFSYNIPEAANLDSKILNHKIDSIANFAIAEGAFPGCQVLVAKDMQVVFHKTYGYHTFEKKQAVQETDIYDFASVTKIAASTLALMKLYDEKHFQLDDKFSSTWTDWKETEKDTLTWRELLAHQAGLKAWIPFWMKMVDKKGYYKSSFLRKDSSELFSVKIQDSLFLRKTYKKEIYTQIKETKLSDEKKYKYSGLTFYLHPQIVKDITNTDFEQFLKEEFYKPLGANHLTFNAFKHFPLTQIIPTENDTFFRKKQIQGSVHDEGAIIMGGVSGNAGLFGTANDIAKLMQMFSNMGYYGGKQLLAEKTVQEFTRIQYPENDNRRGLGFDKPSLGNDTLKFPDAYPAPSASKKSFGHSGYTGTFVWADPETDILFIFLSNRVYPTRENKLIYKLNIRPALHQAIYDAVK